MIDEKRKKEIDEFLEKINLTANDYSFLDKALTHSSYPFENKLPDSEDNERLEFLGDAVLKLIASKCLYERFPDYSEGELTKIRAVLVSDKTLAGIAEELNLGKYLKLGYHEEKTGGRTRPSTLACGFEAILGAFYLDGEFHCLYDFCVRLFEEEITKIDKSASKYNYKAILQEYAQAGGLEVPDYIVVKEEGPPHNKLFKVEVFVNGEKSGAGEGKTKKDAHQKAAEKAVNVLKILEGSEEQCEK